MTTEEKQVLGELRDAYWAAADSLPDDSEWRPWVMRQAHLIAAAAKLPVLCAAGELPEPPKGRPTPTSPPMLTAV